MSPNFREKFRFNITGIEDQSNESTGSPKKMSLNFRENVNYHLTGIEEQIKNGTVSPKRGVTEFRDSVHFHVTGTGGHKIKKLDWFSKKDVTEISRQCPPSQYSPAAYLHHINISFTSVNIFVNHVLRITVYL